MYASLYFEDADEMQAVLTEVHEKVYELKIKKNILIFTHLYINDIGLAHVLNNTQI